MKIIISAKGKSIDSEVDPRFGRCSNFVIYDDMTGKYDFVMNPGGTSSGGAGIQAARAVVEHKVDVALTGRIGPNAMKVLEAANIEVYSGISGTIKKTLDDFKQGKLTIINEANASVHEGLAGV